jgi:hypothetical protein
VGDGGREAGCVLDAPGAHPGGHCCWTTAIEWEEECRGVGDLN